jgi:hypothetical protein
MIIGVLSDTHGVLSDAAKEALRGVDQIIHAGDVDGPAVLKTLRTIAPVSAVRGNMDHGSWAEVLHPEDMISLNGTMIYVLHDLDRLDLDPVAAGIEVVISGHTHRPDIRFIRDVLYLNPGSASHGRRGNPPSIAILDLGSDRVSPRIVPLEA